MTSLAAKVTTLEAVVARLVASRGPKVSDGLKRARARSMAGEVAPVLHDVAELERQATLQGVVGRLARARLRLLAQRDPALEGLLPAKDACGEVGSTGTPASVATRSTGPQAAATAASVSDALVTKIDALVGRYG
jgi:hypothetical protein